MKVKLSKFELYKCYTIKCDICEKFHNYMPE